MRLEIFSKRYFFNYEIQQGCHIPRICITLQRFVLAVTENPMENSFEALITFDLH
jgi:hypothetical protein